MKPFLLLVVLVVGCQSAPSWRDDFDRLLPVLGHRNFIVIADSAYPAQASPGITTLYTGEDHLETILDVLEAVDAAPHVRPILYLDSELADVSEADAPGAGSFRQALESALEGREVEVLEHMQIIEKLDASAELFRVLILKTRGVIPYTSAFIELDCGYWDAEAEGRLRATRR